tara:strand:- start:35 stop:163 length:129 start_codon:yes stop_codon:yes gene_type:complete
MNPLLLIKAFRGAEYPRIGINNVILARNWKARTLIIYLVLVA